MSRWWETDMASAGQALYADPSMALDAATVPDQAFEAQGEPGAINEAEWKKLLSKYNNDKQEVQQKRSGFLGAILNFGDAADDVANSLTGGAWDAVQDNVLKPAGRAVWYPVDKLASGAHWLYSEAVSQPLSMLLIQSAKAEQAGQDQGVGEAWKQFLTGSWTDSYHEAENVSPAQAFMNYENTMQATGEGTLLGEAIAPGGKKLNKAERDTVKRNQERFLYDTDYWREKQGTSYTVGTGVLDGLIVLFGDPSNLLLAGAGSVIKGARSVQMVENSAGELVRSRGAVTNLARTAVGKKAETAEDVAAGKQMQKFFDWVAEPGANGAARKSQAEIASHPIFGRGRRQNPAKNQIAELLSKTEREDMPTMFRFAAGDNAAAAELAERGNDVLRRIGSAAENRVAVDSLKFDPEFVSYFASKESGETALEESTKLFEPPTPRPTTPGPAQQGWDARWGDLVTKGKLHQEAIKAIQAAPAAGPIGAAQDTLLSDIEKMNTWREAKLNLIDDELTELKGQRETLSTALGANMGRAVEEFSPSAEGTVFGGMDRAYRMGSGAFRDAERAAEKKFANKMRDRKGRISTDGYRRSFYGTPLRIVQAFGDRAPVGRVNHNDADAGDRVYDMLREVRGLGPEQREAMLTRYLTAGDKVAKDKVLEGIHGEIVNHLAQNVHGLDGEVARVIGEMTRIGVASTMTKLLGPKAASKMNAGQAFSAAKNPVTGKTVDYVDDGVGYVLTPLAKTQLDQTTALLPIKELDRFLQRNGSAIKQIRKTGGRAADIGKMFGDNLSTIWKAATLLRPAYVPRMISEEAMASAIKFGFMSRLVADPAIGMKNFVLNRANQVYAEVGKGSYSPSTGKQIESRFAVAKVGDERLAENVTKRRSELKRQIQLEPDALKKATLKGELDALKLSRVRVAKSLPIVRARVKMEAEMHAGLQKDLARYQSEYDEIVKSRAQTYQYQGRLDTAAKALADARNRVADIRSQVTPLRKGVAATRGEASDLAKLEPDLQAQLLASSNPIEEMARMHGEAQKFLKAARKAAGQNKVRWGDKDWKYDAGQLDELTAWEAKTAKALRSQQVKTGGIKSALDLLAQQGKEFDEIVARMTGDKEWWNTALKVAEKRAEEARSNLGKVSTRAHAPIVDSADRMTSLMDKMDDIRMRMADHQSVMDEFTDYSNEILRNAVAGKGRRIGDTGTFEAFGYQIPKAFSGEWQNPVSRDQISSMHDGAAASLYARQEAVDMGRAIATGGWDYITPDQPQHMAEWLNALNRQWKQDELFMRVADDPTGKNALAWLKTPAGKRHLADLGVRGRDPERLVEDIRLTWDKYLPEDTMLRQKLLDGDDITEADLVKAIPEGERPTVHGQEILDKTGLWAKDQPGNMLDTMIKKGFERMGAIPSDVMSRHPVYVRFQEGRYKELLGKELSYRKSVGKDDRLTPADLEQILHKSDKLARNDMRQIVYDPQRTSASEALRFIAPFFSAHADGLARWGGLIAEKPEALSKLARIYNAPVAANMVTDGSGNEVNKRGYADVIDPSTGKVTGKKFVPIEERVLNLRMPWEDKSKGSMPIKIQAMNTILPGDPWWNPGAGPLVQVAGSELAKASPSVGDFLQWSKVLPYGPSNSMVEAITPKYMRTLWDAYKGDDPDNVEYQRAYLAIYNRKAAEFHQGEQDYIKAHPNATAEERAKALEKYKFSTKDIEEEAKHFLFMNVLEAWASPAQTQRTPLTGSPYQFYVDQYSKLKEIDPENAADLFQAKYGSDYAGFTASLTKSMGIAATISADMQAEKYRDQIAADPDMAAFWIGDIYNGGAFSSSVYQKQKGQSFGGRKARENITAEQAIENSQVSAGWKDYQAGKMYLDSLLIRNGFVSYTESGAEDINAARQQLVEGLSSKYPAWGNAFAVTDRNIIPDRIHSFEMALADEKLAKDPMRQDIPVLAQYLAGRREFQAMLAQRPTRAVSYDVSGMPTGENADIGLAWRQFQMGLVNSSIAFNTLFNRYLSNDDLQ